MKCRKFSNSNGYNIRLTSSPRYQSAQDADGIVLSVFARTGREDAVLHPNLSLESETLKKAGFTAHCTSCHIGFSPGQIDSKIRRHWQLYKGKPHRRRTWPKVENPRTSQGISRLSSSSYRPDNGRVAESHKHFIEKDITGVDIMAFAAHLSRSSGDSWKWDLRCIFP